MTIREVNDAYISELEARERAAPPLKRGGGGGTFDGMDARVTRLEVQMEHVDRALISIDGKLDKVNERLMALPSKTDLYTFRWQWVLGALALIALVVGGIIGGLAWIQPAPSSPTPIVIQPPAARP